LAGDTSVYSGDDVNRHSGAFTDALDNIQNQIETMQESIEQMQTQLLETTSNLLFAENGPLDPNRLTDPNSFIGKLFHSNGKFIQKIEEFKEVLTYNSEGLKALKEKTKLEVMTQLSGQEHGTHAFGVSNYFIQSQGMLKQVIEEQGRKNIAFIGKIGELLGKTENALQSSSGLNEKINSANNLFETLSRGNGASFREQVGEEQPIIEIIKIYDEVVSTFFDDAKELVEAEYYLAQGSAYLTEWWMGYGIQHANNLHQAEFKNILKSKNALSLEILKNHIIFGDFSKIVKIFLEEVRNG